MSETRDTGAPAPCREGVVDDALADMLIDTLIKDFREHGATVVATLRQTDPKGYIATIGRFVSTNDSRGLLVVNTLIDLRGRRD